MQVNDLADNLLICKGHICLEDKNSDLSINLNILPCSKDKVIFGRDWIYQTKFVSIPTDDEGIFLGQFLKQKQIVVSDMESRLVTISQVPKIYSHKPIP